MELKEHVKEIRDALRAGNFPNEAAVSNGVVMRLLQALGWPVFDSRIVWPQYTVEGRRVDFALCHKDKPDIFIEVKQVGQGEGADRQLFEYAFHSGIPMAVLTDGEAWHFYLPAERGHYEERRVYMLNILERSVDECAEIFNRYLAYQAVCSGKSIQAARNDYQDVARKRDIEGNLPVAWQKLLEEQDALLIELIADKVEGLCGFKPDLDAVTDFLAELPRLSEHKPVKHGKEEGTEKPPVKRDVEGVIGFVLDGQRFTARNAKDVLINVMERLSSRDKTFFERFAARPRHGTKRRFVARTKEELYPGRPDLCRGKSYQSKSGWWVGTNYSKRNIELILRMACEVAGIKFGSDLKVNLGD